MTRAPASSAMRCEPSVDPLSAIRISAINPRRSMQARAFRMQVSSVSASFKQGMRTVTSRLVGLDAVTVAGWMMRCGDTRRIERIDGLVARGARPDRADDRNDVVVGDDLALVGNRHE